MPDTRMPVVFIHGLWLHADSWSNWVELYREAGYEPIAPPWPGLPDTVERSKAHPETIAVHGLAEIADAYVAIIARLPAKPVVVGHSLGGLIALNLLGRNLTAATIAIDAAPIKGVLRMPMSAVRTALPILRNPANTNRAVPLTAAEFRYGFANAVSDEEAADLYQRCAIAGPGRPMFEAVLANLAPRSPAKVETASETRAPLLLLAGEKDRAVPPAVTKAILKQYRKTPGVSDFIELPQRGHSLTIDSGWRGVAHTTLAWLATHLPAPPVVPKIEPARPASAAPQPPA
jgi:pimeloyl-ACP methyl ester carboxylesterase